LSANEQYRLIHEWQATAANLDFVTMYSANPYRSLIECLHASAPSPAVTFYDGASGERIELSYKSLENWVAKSANFLIDEFEVSADDALFVELPAHWLKVVWFLGIWASGCRVASSRQEASHVVSDAPSEGDDIYCSLQVMGKLAPAPPGFVDFVTEVRRHGDYFAPDTALAELQYPEDWRVSAGSRILFARNDLLPQQVAAVLDTRSSLVILRHPNEALKATIIHDEKITQTWD